MLIHDTTTVERVRAAIATLPPAERDLLVLRFRDDLSTTALAAATGASIATVERRLHRAAWVVEDAIGGVPPSPGRVGPERAADLVVEEAALGITPLLAARLVAAVTGPVPPTADDRWRWHALVAALRHNGDGVLTAVVAAAVFLPAVVSLTAG